MLSTWFVAVGGNLSIHWASSVAGGEMRTGCLSMIGTSDKGAYLILFARRHFPPRDRPRQQPKGAAAFPTQSWSFQQYHSYPPTFLGTYEEGRNILRSGSRHTPPVSTVGLQPRGRGQSLPTECPQARDLCHMGRVSFGALITGNLVFVSSTRRSGSFGDLSWG